MHFEVQMEVMALPKITEDFMSCQGRFVYSFNGSAQSRAGTYVIQSLSVKGIQRNLLTLGIFTEKRDMLTKLIKLTVEIMSSASGYKSSCAAFLCKTDFTLSDSTSHNQSKMEHFFENEGIQENAPEQLLCSVHLLMLLQKKIKEHFQDIHMIRKKTNQTLPFRRHKVSYIVELLRSSSNYISKEYSAKP